MLGKAAPCGFGDKIGTLRQLASAVDPSQLKLARSSYTRECNFVILEMAIPRLARLLTRTAAEEHELDSHPLVKATLT